MYRSGASIALGVAVLSRIASADPPLASAVSDDSALHSSIGWGLTVVPDRVSISTEAGYDGSEQRVEATALVEATVVTRLSVFAAVTYGEETTGASRPAVGAAYQLTDPHDSAVGTRISVAYKPEGFSEPEGEIETVAVLSRLIGRDVARTFVAYGSDPDGHESDVEIGAGYLHCAAEHLVIGATTRYRYAIALKGDSPRWDLIGGAIGDLAIRRWRVELLLGGGAAETTTVAMGLLGLVSVGVDM